MAGAGIFVRPPFSPKYYMRKKRFRGLFFNAVLALSLISLVPFVFVGIHLTRVNSRLLQHEIFQKQQTVARRLVSVVQSYISHTSEFFTVFIDLHTDFGGHAFLNEQDLDYLRQKEPTVSSLSLLNVQGQEVLSSGESDDVFSYNSLWPQIVQTCIVQRVNYIGPVAFSPTRGWLVFMAFPVYENLDEKRVSGVLSVQLQLESLGQLLMQSFPLEMEAFVVNAQQGVIAYNGVSSGLMAKPNPQLQNEMREIHEQLAGENTGEIHLSNGRHWLVASADINMLSWQVYVAQPANTASKLIFESTIHSLGGVLRLLLIMVLFILGVSYWVIIPITRPLERLRKAALRLREGDDVIHRQDVDIPHNEIGDLAEVFLEMSEVLHARRAELLAAQNELAASNQELEERVEERTRELQAATSQLVRNERLATMGQMASIISHEIRNPLAVISNATRLIKMLVKNPDIKISRQIGIIEAEIKQANGIISEVLGYVRSREPILNKVDVNRYIHDILISYPIPPNITLVEKLEAQGITVKIDMEEMKQAVCNLFSNAVEAMQNGGTLTVGTKAGRNIVCIYVADTGSGVPEKIREQIFAPFFTTKARGTGLGLAVVGKAVGRHEGKIFISSQEGVGSCFQIYLKIYRNIGDTRYGKTR